MYHRDWKSLPGAGALKLGIAGFGVKTSKSFLLTALNTCPLASTHMIQLLSLPNRDVYDKYTKERKGFTVYIKIFHQEEHAH